MRPGNRSAQHAHINPDRILLSVTGRVARDHTVSHAIITPRILELARRQAKAVG
jgi:hypothetical protein